MPERSLDALTRTFYPLACELVARVTARGVAVMVVQTRRTIEEHQANLQAGTSSTKLSPHLPRRLRIPTSGAPVGFINPYDAERADAIDLAPYEVYLQHGPDKLNWDGHNAGFGVIGEEAERLGLRWGGRWYQPYDPGHAELLLPSKAILLAQERSRPWPTFT